jgi:histidyl-tRNA synthetase
MTGKPQRIEPRTLKGFRDTLPALAAVRNRTFRTLERVFESYGYAPIDTPALEYAEILKGKGGEESDKQMFEFDDAGERRVAMRFDLTVPLARFVAQHQNELVFPFRRYHIGPVWRGERPQKGRFREFTQCDADLIGATGPVADAEVLSMFVAAYEALAVGDFEIRVSDRRVLAGLLETLGVAERSVPVLRAIDKWDKVGADGVRAELEAAGVAGPARDRLLGLSSCAAPSNPETLARFEALVGGSALARGGVEALREVLRLVEAGGASAARVRVDPTLARGLDYYTGIVFEASLVGADVGSVGSGGRYDDLAGLYTNTRLPGVGCSVGIDRLLVALEGRGGATGASTAPAVLVTQPEEGDPAGAVGLAGELRRAGVSAEAFPERRKHANQMKYADKRGVRGVLTLDADGSVHGKDLKTSQAFRVARADVVAEVRRRLA